MELKKKNSFITAFDDDGMITIQMSVESVNKIIDVFDVFIMNHKEHNEIIEFTEFGKTFKLDLSLKNSDGLSLTATILNSNFYHDFELENFDIKTWNKIKEITMK